MPATHLLEKALRAGSAAKLTNCRWRAGHSCAAEEDCAIPTDHSRPQLPPRRFRHPDDPGKPSMVGVPWASSSRRGEAGANAVTGGELFDKPRADDFLEQVGQAIEELLADSRSDSVMRRSLANRIGLEFAGDRQRQNSAGLCLGKGSFWQGSSRAPSRGLKDCPTRLS